MFGRRIPLLTLTVLPVALAVAIMVGLYSAWVQQAWFRFAQESYLEINDQVAAGVEVHLDGLLKSPHQILSATAGAIKLGIVDLSDDVALQKYLVNGVRALPEITNLSLGRDDGRYINAYRVWNGRRDVMVSVAGAGASLDSFFVDDQGRSAEPFNSIPGFDVTQRPWYRAALERREPVWFPPYTFFSGSTVAIGMSQRIDFPDGGQGVLAVDISVDDLSRLLASLDVARQGAAFIMTANGMLLADSSGTPVLRTVSDASRIPHASESSLGAVRRISGTLLEADGNFRGILPGESDVDLVHARRYVRNGGLELIIGISVPRSSYAEALGAELRNGAMVALLIGIVGLFAIFMIGRSITRPVRQLTKTISQAGVSQLSDEVPRSRIREIDQLALSFSRLSQHLRGVMASLEEQVRQRTAELQTANVQLKKLSRTDAGTGLANRRHFEATLSQQWRRATRQSKPLSLVLGDIDYFKAFNDAYGHPAGDRALTTVARLLTSRARRSSDLVARIGGEEFAFLLPDVEGGDALEFSESVRQGLEALALEHRESPLGIVTMSFGVATATPTRGNALEATQLVAAADKALYRAKNAGRNRVEAAPDVQSRAV